MGKKSGAERQRKLRLYRDANHLCRTCGDPVAPSTRTGKPSKLCAADLEKDRERKSGVRPLRWEPIVELAWLP